MKMNCGHNACDFCGAYECKGTLLRKYKDIYCCDYCHNRALNFALYATQTMSAMIDQTKECGNKKREPVHTSV